MRGARLLERPAGAKLVSAIWELDSGVDANLESPQQGKPLFFWHQLSEDAEAP